MLSDRPNNQMAQKLLVILQVKKFGALLLCRRCESTFFCIRHFFQAGLAKTYLPFLGLSELKNIYVTHEKSTSKGVMMFLKCFCPKFFPVQKSQTDCIQIMTSNISRISIRMFESPKQNTSRLFLRRFYFQNKLPLCYLILDWLPDYMISIQQVVNQSLKP